MNENFVIRKSNTSILDKFIFLLGYIRTSIFPSATRPLIPFTIGDVSIKMPISHRLGILQRVFPNYSLNLGRIARYVKEKYNDLVLIDIGANIGDSVAILREQSFFPILAIEGDDDFFEILKENCKQFRDVTLVKAFVGERDEDISAGISSIIPGSNILSKDEEGQSISLLRLSHILQQNNIFKKAKMLKIDTDGFDCKIIRGSLNWLKEAKPIVFFEYDPSHLMRQNDDGISIFFQLESLGYSSIIVYHNTGEYMFSAELSNKKLIEDIHEYFSGRNSRIYADICAFHFEDNDLFEKIRLSEIDYFSSSRK